MITKQRAEGLKERVQEILNKELSVEDVQNTLSYHCNYKDDDTMMLEQLQNRRFRGLVE